MNPDPTLSDCSHENAAFVRSAVEQFQAQLLRYATRLLGDPDRARDVVQDTFVRLLAQPRAAVDGHLAEWLFTVCRNRTFDINRKESRMRRFDEGAVERVVAAEPRPGAGLEAEEAQLAVLRLIERLPPKPTGGHPVEIPERFQLQRDQPHHPAVRQQRWISNPHRDQSVAERVGHGGGAWSRVGDRVREESKS